MIHVDRNKTPEPDWLRSNKALDLRAKAGSFFSQPGAKREQSRFDFETGILRQGIGASLAKLFSQKCAFCEQKLDIAPDGKGAWDLEQFRPKQLGGDSSAPDHYWWLSYSWENLYPACATCNRNKRNLFPIAGARCRVGATGEELAREEPLLIDPCSEQPEKFLIFGDNGIVVAIDGNSRGETTIKLHELNRVSLVSRRQDCIRTTKNFLARCVTLISRPRVGKQTEKAWHELGNRLTNEAEFAAAQRWACARMLVTSIPEGAEEVADRFLSGVSGSSEYLRSVRQSHLPTKPHARLARSPAPTPDIVRAVVVVQVELSNYRIISKLKFKISENRPAELKALETETNDHPPTRGWKMILGENGSGKSSVLHAVALALMGRDFYEEKKSEYGFAQNRGRRSTNGKIQVWLSGDSKPIELLILPNRLQWTNGHKGANIFLRGYGASRLLPKRNPSNERRRQSPTANPRKNVDNLFDPFAPLINAEVWLRGLDDDNFRRAAINLKDLLDIKKGEADLDFEVRTARRSGRFGLWKGKRKREKFTPLEHFSAGYQTMLALACDIMAGAGGKVEDMINAPGVILIDEIGTNLHPRWRMEIVGRLRKAFPAMQFIASTHEPLCLRGLGQGEAAVMHVHRGVATLLDNLPSPAGLRVDQLLTSEFFGLNTTIDPETEKQFGLYYDLLEREGSLMQEERLELERLRNELAGKSVLGSSRRDRLILNIIDKFLVQSRAAGSEPFPKPTQDVIQQVGDALKSIEPLKRFV